MGLNMPPFSFDLLDLNVRLRPMPPIRANQSIQHAESDEGQAPCRRFVLTTRFVTTSLDAQLLRFLVYVTRAITEWSIPRRRSAEAAPMLGSLLVAATIP